MHTERHDDVLDGAVHLEDLNELDELSRVLLSARRRLPLRLFQLGLVGLVGLVWLVGLVGLVCSAGEIGELHALLGCGAVGSSCRLVRSRSDWYIVLLRVVTLVVEKIKQGLAVLS